MSLLCGFVENCWKGVARVVESMMRAAKKITERDCCIIRNAGEEEGGSTLRLGELDLNGGKKWNAIHISYINHTFHERVVEIPQLIWGLLYLWPGRSFLLVQLPFPTLQRLLEVLKDADIFGIVRKEKCK